MMLGFCLVISGFLVLSGCDDNKDKPEDSGRILDAGSPGAACDDLIATTDEDGDLLVVATADQNYSFESNLSAETISVRPTSNLHFDWSEVTVDLVGRDFDPLSSVDMMEVMLWQYSKEDLLRDINDDNLDRGRLRAIAYLDTGKAMSVGDYLDILSAGGSQQPEEVLLEYLDTTVYSPEKYSYLFMVAEGNAFGNGTKMLTLFQPDPDETNTEVRLTTSSAALDYSVDLTSLIPIAVPAGTPNIVFDWIDENSELGTNAMGAEWIPNWITDVKIAHYESLDREELEERFLDIDIIADEMWTVYLTVGQSVNLGTLTNEEGEAFHGIDDTGTWVITLICGICTHPAPWFLSVLRPCSE